jgi:hypothetical protein
MQKFKYLLYLLSAVLIMGCGQTVVETLHVPAPQNPNAPGKGQTIVILPFADYTYADSLAGAYRRNLSVTEAITDRLVSNGFGMAIQEDVFGYLVNENIISIVPYDENNTTSLSDELNNEWSDVMKNQLRGYIQNQKMHSGKTVSASPGTHAINQKTIAKMGRKFNADYIVRGRILEFKTREENTWAPWKRGLLPFVSGVTSRTLNGFARSDQYDDWGHMLAGGTWGAIIGHNVGGPWNPDASNEVLGLSGSSANTIFWGAVGVGLGHMAKNGGKVDQAVVQMRIWVQEAATGNLVWTNRVDVKVSPESFLADNQYDALFDKAIHKGVNTLIDNFVEYGL